MSEQERRLRQLLAREAHSFESSHFMLETQSHPLLNPAEHAGEITYLPCCRGRVADTSRLSTSSSSSAPVRSLNEAAAPALFCARLRPQFTQLQELNLRAIERRAQYQQELADEDAQIKARAALARERAHAAADVRRSRAQRQAERKAHAAGLQATRRLQEDYTAMGRIGR